MESNKEIVRRNRPGTKVEDLYRWTPEDYSKMKGLFSVQEYIQELVRDDPANIKKIIEKPLEVETNIWIYEHLRQFILETNLLIVQLQGVCTRQSCSKMKATDDVLYLCAVHKDTQECSAIDYMIHNLDQMTNILNDSKQFPSRVSISKTSVKSLENIVRRLYRYFSHSFNHHKEIFFEFEKDMHLYERFVEYIRSFDMMSKKYIIIPENFLQSLN